ncbi:hypothetical protein JCM11251_001431 [Rhodosporidiobolus azoricus]
MLAHAAVAALAVSTVSASVILDKRAAPGRPGAVGFVNPPLRGWIAETTRTAPCGGVEQGGRVDFPLVNGDLSFILQRDVNNLQVSYSLASNPSSLSDFSPAIPVLDQSYSGTKCFEAPDFTSFGASAGDLATLSITYTAGKDQASFYQCADIVLVDAANFVSESEYTCANVTTSTQTRGDQSKSSSVSTSANASSAKDDQPVSPIGAGFLGAAVAIVLCAFLAAGALVAGFAKVGSRSKMAALGGARQDLPAYAQGDAASMTSRTSMLKA